MENVVISLCRIKLNKRLKSRLNYLSNLPCSVMGMVSTITRHQKNSQMIFRSLVSKLVLAQELQVGKGPTGSGCHMMSLSGTEGTDGSKKQKLRKSILAVRFIASESKDSIVSLLGRKEQSGLAETHGSNAASSILLQRDKRNSLSALMTRTSSAKRMTLRLFHDLSYHLRSMTILQSFKMTQIMSNVLNSFLKRISKLSFMGIGRFSQVSFLKCGARCTMLLRSLLTLSFLNSYLWTMVIKLQALLDGGKLTLMVIFTVTVSLLKNVLLMRHLPNLSWRKRLLEKRLITVSPIRQFGGIALITKNPSMANRVRKQCKESGKTSHHLSKLIMTALWVGAVCGLCLRLMIKAMLKSLVTLLADI